MAIFRHPKYHQLCKAVAMLVVAVLSIALALVLSACGESQPVTSAPQMNNDDSSQKSEQGSSPNSDSGKSNTTEQPKTMTKADQAARDSLIIDAEARGFTYVSDQTEYHPNLDTSDTGGLSTNSFTFTVKVGTCQPDGVIRYTKTKGATKFVVDDWTAKLTIKNKEIGNTFVNMDRLKKRAIIWKYTYPELYECITSQPSNN